MVQMYVSPEVPRVPSDWLQLAREARSAAHSLTAPEHCRSCVSRCYYAAYLAVTGELLRQCRGITFAHGWGNPPHHELPRYIKNNLTGLPISTRRELSRDLRLLYKMREDADYRPSATVDADLATDARRVAHAVLGALGVQP